MRLAWIFYRCVILDLVTAVDLCDLDSNTCELILSFTMLLSGLINRSFFSFFLGGRADKYVPVCR